MKRQEPPPIRLVLLDDHEDARRRSAARLQQHPQIKVVGEAADRSSAFALAQELQPDAVLVESRRADERGLEAIALLRSLDGSTRPAIVAYLEILHRDDWPSLRAAGADDLLLKELPPASLVGELRQIIDRARGEGRVHPDSA